MPQNKLFERNGASYLMLENDEIFLGNGELSTSAESFIIQSDVLTKYNYLIFMDSRGAKVENDSISTIKLLMKYFDELKLSYLVISRPLNLTITATLLSFLENSIFKFERIITNVGFVDTTPKKKDTLNDIRCQFNDSNIGYKYQVLENFKLSNGLVEELGTLCIDDYSINNIAARLKKINSTIYFINTPEISKNNTFKRQRPKSFFEQINKSNHLIKKISNKCNGKLINISSTRIKTFDGVHFTDLDHKICFREIIPFLSI